MSGKPYPEGIGEMRAALSHIHALQCMVAQKHEEAIALKAKIEAAVATISEEKAKVIGLMRDMDIAANGNFGWEWRVLWALTELVSQTSTHAREHP